MHKNREYFGEISFFTGKSRDITAQSCDFTTMVKISRNHFIDIVNNE